MHFTCWLNGEFLDHCEENILTDLRAITAVLNNLPEDFTGSCDSPEFLDVFTDHINREVVAIRQALTSLRVLFEADMVEVPAQK